MKSSFTKWLLGSTLVWSCHTLGSILAQDITTARDTTTSSIVIVDTPSVIATPSSPSTPSPLQSQDIASDVTSSPNAPPTDPQGVVGLPPASLIEPTDAMRKLAPPKYVGHASASKRAIPTNNWWGNIIAHDNSNAIQPVWSNPYALQIIADSAPFGLSVSYPFRSRVLGGSSGNGNANRYYAHGLVREFMFSASEFGTRPIVKVTDWADIGVTVKLSNGAATMQSTLVSGMAYVTATYSGGITPKFLSTATIVSVNGQAAAGGLGPVTASKFELVYNSGQKWVLYALASDGTTAKPITLSIEAGSTLKASTVFDGIVRVALAVQDAWIPTLDTYKTCLVNGASVSIDSDTSYAFHWKTSGDCSKGMLHYAMQHQLHTLDAASARPVDRFITYSTTRGVFQAVTTSGSTASPVWKFTEAQAIAEDFYPARKITPQVANEQRLYIQLKADIASAWSIPLDGSYYFNGKAAQKYAALCLMANDAVIVGQDKALLASCLSKLRSVMTPFLTNAWTNKLQYDNVYGGIVSSEGFKKNDLGADFGNTMYNDHHFHYGYWLHTTAVINLLDPTWSELGRLNTMANWLARDVANFDTDEQFFPRFRSFDWFRGHSYSHGVTPFADGKDQESTSEDINFSYSLYLLGKVTKNARMETVGKLMARLNAHAIRTYFLMDDDNQVHPAAFKPNKVTGIFFDNKVDYATWFSAEKHCIHGIQMIPISPMTEFVRTKAFVKQEWDSVLSKTAIVVKQDTGNPWLSLLYANYATVDKTAAMSVLQKATMDDGLTRAWALYMAASMP